ncbi:MAG TPA: adhesin [Marinilabiliaceae bacterium]|nr:adhesin [Marinilabiliaceae bacterium]
MKRILFIAFITALVSSLFTSCENGDWEFPDFEYSAVYFAYQSPVRTVVLGEDVYDTSLDNEHKVMIMATMGGVYANNMNVEIDIEVDNSLVDGLIFKKNVDTDPDVPVLAMPEAYYTLSSDKIVIEKGSVIGGVTVQLTDAFFADPLALSTNYVIPILMTDVVNADSILSGKALVENPSRTSAADWDLSPKDYILYAVKYINKYDANYLRRGKDVIKPEVGKDTTITRQAQWVERDEVVDKISTRNLNTIAWEYTGRDHNGDARTCTLILTFNEQGECTINSETAGVTASGTGRFVVKGEKNSWGRKDRDALYLDYIIEFADVTFEIEDTLVVRDRGVKAEWFDTQIIE